MKVLITGTDGYIGAVLAPYLLQRGYDITGFDTGYYREGWLFNNGTKNFPYLINMDIRNISQSDLEGFDAVVHLAELSNDHLGALQPDITYKINHQGSVHLAKMAKMAGVKRFVYTSSCSVYGAGSDDFKTETSQVNPQTAYADCKVLVEQDVSKLADNSFSPTFLRNSTAYGPSPRMRFDIVLNNLAGLAWTTKEIALISDGKPWRPLVHVRDIAQAIYCVLQSPREAIHNQVFNVGSDAENYRILDIAKIVSDIFPGCHLKIGQESTDNRSYRVSFKKINSQLPGFKCQNTAESGAYELYHLFKRINLSQHIFQFRAFTRLKQLKHLLSTGQLNENLFWTNA